MCVSGAYGDSALQRPNVSLKDKIDPKGFIQVLHNVYNWFNTTLIIQQNFYIVGGVPYDHMGL